MADYFGGDANNAAATNGDAATNGAVQPTTATTGGEMDDVIS